MNKQFPPPSSKSVRQSRMWSAGLSTWRTTAEDITARSCVRTCPLRSVSPSPSRWGDSELCRIMSPTLCLKVEGQQCVNIPVQQCSNVPVTGPVEVPQERCYKRPRRVCQTLVSTKPKVITAQVPREVCGHLAPAPSSVAPAPVKTSSSLIKRPGSSISRSSDQEPEKSGYYRGEEEKSGYYGGEEKKSELYGEKQKAVGDSGEERGGYYGSKDEKRNWNKEQKDLFYYLMNQKN